MSYYENTWLKQDSHGDLFWKHVDFTAQKYKYQESVFRHYIRKHFVGPRRPMTILELGSGNGRITKIVMEELGPFAAYVAVDISSNSFKQMGEYLGVPECLSVYPKTGDVIQVLEEAVSKPIKNTYDLVIASELFMHILPDDIDRLIEMVTKVGDQVINIDWTIFDKPKKSEWCFAHNYNALYKNNGMKFIDVVPMSFCEQALWHYGFDIK